MFLGTHGGVVLAPWLKDASLEPRSGCDRDIRRCDRGILKAGFLCCAFKFRSGGQDQFDVRMKGLSSNFPCGSALHELSSVHNQYPVAYYDGARKIVCDHHQSELAAFLERV